ncbi:MAG: AMP-binding protein [Rhodobacteraceae bacterium]|nr:AMP-binding protein [Paracoccaceae bacterium]PHR55405.1 MAG: feruloyl-CoA synthetase [Robiginitomaculum sp.]
MLSDVVEKTSDWVHRWAGETPDTVFLAERSGAGWRAESYAATLQKIRVIAAALLGRGMGAQTPILVMSGNGVDHGLLTLAAQYVGVPIVPVAEQYALITGAHGRLSEVISLIRPAMVYAVDAAQYGEALALPLLAGIEIVASKNVGSATPFSTLLAGDNCADVDAANALVGPDTVGKILMTSGSTSRPKGVLTTQRMMCVNQTQISDALPFLQARPPRIMDWLPWNHVFGGSHNFNIMLANGGSLYIDDGKPTKAAFGRTLENLALMTGTIAFNVPVGFSMLLTALQADKKLQQRFFADLDMVFYAGASLPQDVWQGFEKMALAAQGAVPLMTSSWGLTETAPSCMLQHQPIDRSGVVGVPLNGVVAKLIPDNAMRFEVRIKGPNVMAGYFDAPEKTAQAFDDEGYFITGDAMTFVDSARPDLGMRFDGRMSDDFKLQTGTWVRATVLRAEMLALLAPIAAEIVITGHDETDIGVLIFPNETALVEAGFDHEAKGDGTLTCPRLAARMTLLLTARAAVHSSSSTHVARALILAEPPSIADGEVTAKGNLNFRKILTLRAPILARLYNDAAANVIRIAKG